MTHAKVHTQNKTLSQHGVSESPPQEGEGAAFRVHYLV